MNCGCAKERWSAGGKYERSLLVMLSWSLVVNSACFHNSGYRKPEHLSPTGIFGLGTLQAFRTCLLRRCCLAAFANKIQHQQALASSYKTPDLFTAAASSSQRPPLMSHLLYMMKYLESN